MDKFLCWIGLHKWVQTYWRKAVTYHKKLNPLIEKDFICIRCQKTKTTISKSQL